MRTIFQALARRNCILGPLVFPPLSASRSLVTEEQEAALPETLPINIGYLPAHDETERLLQHFFSTTGVLFPYIHEVSFMETYHSIKQQNFNGKVRRIWLALLNVMLAMAMCESSPENSADVSKAAKSHVFYQRSQALCGEQMLQGTTLETGKTANLYWCLKFYEYIHYCNFGADTYPLVQYLLLASQYLQGVQKAMQTWITHGLAVKAALSIGLHSPVRSNAWSAIELEMRKRTWHGCIVLDRCVFNSSK